MTAVPGLPSGQQAYMSNVRLQKSPAISSTVRGEAGGQTQVARPSLVPLSPHHSPLIPQPLGAPHGDTRSWLSSPLWVTGVTGRPNASPTPRAQPGTCRVRLARHPPQALVSVPHPLLEGPLQHLGPTVLQVQSPVWSHQPHTLGAWSPQGPEGTRRNPPSTHRPRSLHLTGTEEKRHIQARWTRLCRYRGAIRSLMAVPAGPQHPDPGREAAAGGGTAEGCAPRGRTGLRARRWLRWEQKPLGVTKCQPGASGLRAGGGRRDSPGGHRGAPALRKGQGWTPPGLPLAKGRSPPSPAQPRPGAPGAPHCPRGGDVPRRAAPRRPPSPSPPPSHPVPPPSPVPAPRCERGGERAASAARAPPASAVPRRGGRRRRRPPGLGAAPRSSRPGPAPPRATGGWGRAATPRGGPLWGAVGEGLSPT